MIFKKVSSKRQGINSNHVPTSLTNLLVYSGFPGFFLLDCVTHSLTIFFVVNMHTWCFLVVFSCEESDWSSQGEANF